MFAYFDIGGTKTRVAVSRDGQTLSEPLKFDTPKNFEEGIQTILDSIRTLAPDEEVTAAGGGIAGHLDATHTSLVRSPNMATWEGRPVTEALSSALNAPVYMENDSAVVGLGEAQYGAGKGVPVLAYITVSTGVGGARIVDGRIDRNVFGFEPGHQILDLDGTVFPLMKAAEAEDMLSGTALARRFHRAAYTVQDPKVWEELARLLAYMLNNTIVHWSPHVVVLGGSMMVGDPAIPLERTQYYLNEVCTIFSTKPTLKLATLADVGGLYGAMAYVAQMHAEQY